MLVDFHVLEAVPYASHILDLTPVRRPDTPMGNLETQQKLSLLDQRLAALEDGSD